MTVYYRIQSADDDPEGMLDPDNQFAEPWDGADQGRCDKCGGSGRTTYECESCREKADDACPSCSGERRFEDECPACLGEGRITDSRRRGVSVFPDEDALYRYMVRRDGRMENSVLVELRGRPSDDRDFDADEGACLVHPTEIVTVREVDRDRVSRAERELSGSVEKAERD